MAKSFNPEFKNELDIESIISAPLVAASKANVVMVTGQTRFLLDYCFKKIEVDGKASYEPQMIEMSMTRGTIEKTEATESTPASNYIRTDEMKFNIPLLCLVPLSSLAIDKVTVDFDLEITSASSKVYTPGVGKNQILDKKAQLNGRIGNDSKNADRKNSNNRQVNSRLKVGINASPLPLPQGVLTIIDLYTKNIQPLPKEKEPDQLSE